MNSEESTLNPSSLLDLKAELHKKYESFRKAKLVQNSCPSRRASLKRKNEPAKDKKEITASNATLPKEEILEEDLSLKKSRLALEAKAKIYEKITSSNVLIDDEENERYLVDFQRKVLYESPVNKNSETEETINSTSNIEDDLTYSENLKEAKMDMPLKNPFYKFSKKEETETPDGPIHYQNVQFNEIRDHGTGYFAFSTDEFKRKEQMEELNSLRQETEQQRLSAQKLQKKRMEMLQARLAKVCERRNIDKSVVKSHAALQDEQALDKNQEVDLSSIPLPEPTSVIEKKEVKIRPWDVGKTEYMFVPEKSKIKSQNAWIEERRSERQSEFAPPSFYK